MLYKAFISYSHAADGKLAPAVQHALHRIAKPWYRLRTMRVFRDQTNLANNPGLWTEIEKALRESEFFIYLASPTAVKSAWVQKEVDWWLTNRSPKNFLIVLTDGRILWDEAARDLDWGVTTALMPRLSNVFAEEPQHTDVRWALGVDQLSLRHSQFRTAILDLAATLLRRSKDELDGDDVRQHRRTVRIVSAALAVFLIVGGALAVQTRNFARERLDGIEAHGRQLLAAADESGALPLLAEAHSLRQWIPGAGDDASLRFMLARAIAHLDGRIATYWSRSRANVDVVAIRPDGRQLLTVESNGQLSLWNNGESEPTPVKTEALVIDAMFVPGTARVITLEKTLDPGDGTVPLSLDISRSLVDATNGKVLESYEVDSGIDPEDAEPGNFRPPGFSSNGDVFFLSEQGREAAAYSIVDGQKRSGITPPPAVRHHGEEQPCQQTNVRLIASSTNGKKLLTERGTLLQSSDCRWVGSLDSSVPVRAGVFTNDGTAVLTAQRDAAILWKTRRPRASELAVDSNGGQSAVFIDANSTKVAVAYPSKLVVLDPIDRKVASTSDSVSTTTASVERLIPLSGRFIARSQNDSPEIWNTGGARPIKRIRTPEQGENSRGGKDSEVEFFVARQSNTLLVKQRTRWNAIYQTDFEVYSLITGDRLSRMTALGQDYDVIAISQDGMKIFSSASTGPNSHPWVSGRGSWEPEYLKTPGVAPTTLRAATFSPDGRQIIAMGLNRAVYIWAYDTGKLIDAFPARLDDVSSLSLSPAGRYLIASNARQSELLDFGKRASIGLIEGPASGDEFAFSPNDRFVVTAGGDEALRVFETASAQLLWSKRLPGKPSSPARWHPTKPMILVQAAETTFVFNAGLEERGADEIKALVQAHRQPKLASP